MDDNPSAALVIAPLLFVAFCILVVSLFTTQENKEEIQAPKSTHTVTHTHTITPQIDRAITPTEELK